MPTIEELGPDQTTLPLKIFIILRFAFKIVFWSSVFILLIYYFFIPLILYSLKVGWGINLF